ncbi:hypothetical protein FVE85_7337 [Porphyridium purpureum]|uniref:Uncharacterized protein n=1 Tax=Porphyridium purpureum TaxID=35688 RepID=A0A5J4Z9K1_PORPP|nr:hypothetical protein FVE85_7337 [Porphyridium purpureum]|eukprot:POR3397..scf295_1
MAADAGSVTETVLAVLNPYSVVLVCVFITVFAQGKYVWLLLDFFVSLVCGVSFLLTPHVLLSLQTSVKLDLVSLHLMRAIGTMMLSSAFFAYFAYVSTSLVVKEAFAHARVIGNIPLLLAMTYAQIYYTEFSLEHIQFGIVGCVCWTLGPLYCLLSSRSVSKTSSAAYDFFVLVDFIATGVCGCAWYAFPHWVLRYQITDPPNGVSVHLTRGFAAMMIGSAFLSYSATHFSQPEMKRVVLLARIVGAIPLLIEVIAAQVRGAFSLFHIFAGVSGAGFWIGNALLGFLVLNYVDNIGGFEPEFTSSPLDRSQHDHAS